MLGIQNSLPCLVVVCWGDIEIREFERIWAEMVSECGVEDEEWVMDLYEKRHMWVSFLHDSEPHPGLRVYMRELGGLSTVGTTSQILCITTIVI